MEKLSKYNIVIHNQDSKILLYNTLSGALVELDEEYAQYFGLTNKQEKDKLIEIELNNLSEKYKNIYMDLKKGGYIVDCRFDEIQFLKYLSYKSRYTSRANGLTILPTLDCNFKCSYCYEEHPPMRMKQDVQDKLIDLVEKKISEGIPSLNIHWYGGEPLLCLDLIEKMSRRFIEIVKKCGIPFSAEMVTNGYLLDKDVTELLHELKIQKIQVTLDGSPKVHNQHRMLKNGNGTFWKIIENISIASKIIPIILRINIDRKNLFSMKELLEILYKMGLNHKNITPYLGFIRPSTHVCKSIFSDCLTEQEFADYNADFIEELDRKGFQSHIYPVPAFRICGAVSEGVFAITPDGNLFKCWETVAIPEEAIGNILEDKPKIEHQLNLLKWMNYDPFANKKCVECDIFPICFGGCPSSHVEHPGDKICNDVMCSPLRYEVYISKIMEITRLKYLRGDFKKEEEAKKEESLKEISQEESKDTKSTANSDNAQGEIKDKSSQTLEN